MAMSLADRLPVPLKNMCSMKCDIPPISGASCREPTFTHTPMDTERDFGRVSDTTRIPLERVSFLYIQSSFSKHQWCQDTRNFIHLCNLLDVCLAVQIIFPYGSELRVHVARHAPE